MAKNAPVPFGLYLVSQPETILYKFKSKSVAAKTVLGHKTGNVRESLIRNGTYCAKPISADQFANFPCDMSQTVLDQVAAIVQSQGAWTIVNPTVDMDACVACHVSKPRIEEYWAMDNGRMRSTCKMCRNARNADFRAKKDERVAAMEQAGTTNFQCRGNDVGRSAHEAPIRLMRPETSRQCIECYNHKRQVQDRASRQDLSTADARALFSQQFKECMHCHQVKNVGRDFIVKAGRTNAGSVCKRCSLDKAYWKPYRERRKRIDALAFYKHNASVRRRWALKNKDKTQAYNDKRRTSIADRWSALVTRCMANQVPIAMDQHEELSALFTKPCTYCGHEDFSTSLNGLDRIHPDGPYALNNVVPACVPCNLIKREMDLEDLYERITAIVEHNAEDMNVDSTLTTGLGNIISQKLYDELDLQMRDVLQEIYDNLIDPACYLCGKLRSETHNQHMGVDRVDSSQNYSHNNCRPCCTRCNMIKKDFPLDPFKSHLRRMVEHIQRARDMISQTVTENPDVVCSVPERRAPVANRFVPHPKGKALIIRDSKQNNKIVAIFQSIADAGAALQRPNLSSDTALRSNALFKGRWSITKIHPNELEDFQVDTADQAEFVRLACASRSARTDVRQFKGTIVVTVDGTEHEFERVKHAALFCRFSETYFGSKVKNEDRFSLGKYHVRVIRA